MGVLSAYRGTLSVLSAYRGTASVLSAYRGTVSVLSANRGTVSKSSVLATNHFQSVILFILTLHVCAFWVVNGGGWRAGWGGVNLHACDARVACALAT